MATQMTGECHFGLHQHCPKASHYTIGNSGPGYLSAIEMSLPCQCSCHEWNKPVPPADEHGYWTRRPNGGLCYHAYDPATEDDDPGWA